MSMPMPMGRISDQPVELALKSQPLEIVTDGATPQSYLDMKLNYYSIPVGSKDGISSTI